MWSLVPIHITRSLNCRVLFLASSPCTLHVKGAKGAGHDGQSQVYLGGSLVGWVPRKGVWEVSQLRQQVASQVGGPPLVVAAADIGTSVAALRSTAIMKFWRWRTDGHVGPRRLTSWLEHGSGNGD